MGRVGRYSGLTREERQEYLRGLAGSTTSGVTKERKVRVKRDYGKSLKKQLSRLDKPLSRDPRPDRRGDDVLGGRLDLRDIFR